PLRGTTTVTPSGPNSWDTGRRTRYVTSCWTGAFFASASTTRTGYTPSPRRNVGRAGSAGVVLCVSRVATLTVTWPDASGVAGTTTTLPCTPRSTFPSRDAWKSVSVGTRAWSSTRSVAPAGGSLTWKRIVKSASGSTTGVCVTSARASVRVACRAVVGAADTDSAGAPSVMATTAAAASTFASEF